MKSHLLPHSGKAGTGRTGQHGRVKIIKVSLPDFYPSARAGASRPVSDGIGIPGGFSRNRGIQGTGWKNKGSQSIPSHSPVYILFLPSADIFHDRGKPLPQTGNQRFSSECSLCATVTTSGRVSSTYSICELSILTMPRSSTACCSTSVHVHAVHLLGRQRNVLRLHLAEVVALLAHLGGQLRRCIWQ